MKKIAVAMLIISMMILAMACTGEHQDTVQQNSGEESQKDNDAVDSLRAYEGTTLNVLIKTGYESAAIEEYKSDFEEATGIQLNIEVVDEPTLRNRFVLDSTSQTGAYDVVATQFWYMPEYISGGYLEPLNDYIENLPDPWLAIDDFPEGIVSTYEDNEGNIYSIPVSASGGVLMYRTDLFEEYNIIVPQTTEEVLEAAKLLKEKLPSDIVPFVGRGDSSSASFGSTVGWAWAYGASVFDSDGNVTVDSPEMKEALTNWVTLMSEYGPEDAAAMGWDTMSEMFRQGRAAMNFDMSGFPSVYTDPELSQVADHVGVTLITGPSGGNYAQWMYGEGLGISKYSKNKEAAWLFIKWRTSLDVALKEVADGLRIDFPHESIYTTDVYKEVTKNISFADEIPNIMKSIDTTYWPSIVEFEQVAQAFQEEVSLTIAGKQSVEDAVNKAKSKIENIVK